MDDKELLEKQLIKLNKELKMIFDSERQMRAMGNSGMVSRRQQEYRDTEAKIKVLKKRLDNLN